MQKHREAQKLEAIEKKAEERSGTRTDLRQNFGTGESGRATDIVADKVGLGSGETYRKLSKVMEVADEGPVLLVVGIAGILTG